MLVSHRKRFIYTKTVKTAGTSVESYFEPYCVPEGTWQFRHERDEQVSEAGIIGYRGMAAGGRTWTAHMAAGEIRARIGQAVWDAYFKFCVIRDPFDKLVSRFYSMQYVQKARRAAAGGRQGAVPDSGEEGRGETIRRFRKWLRESGAAVDRDKYLIDGEICVDCFIRYEALHAGVAEVCRRLDIPFEPERIPRLKAGIRSSAIPVPEYYDQASIDLVSELYRFELETFGYPPPR